MSKFYIFILIMSDILLCIDFNELQKLNLQIPEGTVLRNRVLTTISCKDCEYIDKFTGAGEIFKTGEQTYQLMHNGIKIIQDCYYGNWITTLIKILKGHHEPQEEKIFHEVLKIIPDNSKMIELGSYWGYYSMWFNKIITNATNYLIEPDPKNLITGINNFKLNNLCGSFTHAMIGEKSIEGAEFIDWDYNKHLVKQINIDDFIEKNGIDFIYILHSDIQGAEIDMLKGCKKSIENKKIGYFFISTHRGTHEPVLEILQNYNLDIIVSHTREESFSADGLIVAKICEIPGPQNIDISKRTPSDIEMIAKVINNQF
jgi:FkbM family methyltransferase